MGSVVKSGLCKRALVQLSYAIGVAKPLSLFVETYGSECGNLTPDSVTDIVKLEFDCRPGALARDLQLRQPKYNVTAAYCRTRNVYRCVVWRSRACDVSYAVSAPVARRELLR